MLLDLEQFKSHWANTFPGIATHNTHFIIAVSGGVDSIVLATLMQQMGAKCSIAHANFQLRGDESNRDERFVQAFATKMDMPFLTKRFDTLAFAEQYKMGIQQAAREIRYAWFESLIKEMDVQAAVQQVAVDLILTEPMEPMVREVWHSLMVEPVGIMVLMRYALEVLEVEVEHTGIPVVVVQAEVIQVVQADFTIHLLEVVVVVVLITMEPTSQMLVV